MNLNIKNWKDLFRHEEDHKIKQKHSTLIRDWRIIFFVFVAEIILVGLISTYSYRNFVSEDVRKTDINESNLLTIDVELLEDTIRIYNERASNIGGFLDVPTSIIDPSL